MLSSTVRLSGIEIRNYKNVTYGSLNFENRRKAFKASVLGLYGQNGSGKTALIDALEILRLSLCGEKIPAIFADLINVDAKEAEFVFHFDIGLPEEKAKAAYRLVISRGENGIRTNLPKDAAEASETSVSSSIVRESLSLSSYQNGRIGRIAKLMDTSPAEFLSPMPKALFLIGRDRKTLAGLGFLKGIYLNSGASFLFSGAFLDAVRQHEHDTEDAELSFDLSVIEALVCFGNRSLYIVNTSDSEEILINLRPMGIDAETGSAVGRHGGLMSVDGPMTVSEKDYPKFKKAIEAMNSVLSELIPGLSLDVKAFGLQLDDTNASAMRFQLMSLKNGKAIALKHESEGIKKIIAILSLLILVYNCPDVTVAVDELDAGVFEYLLGEILRIISEKGKGQLIFTSHNLRPLETLDPGFIAFTTIDPEKRYMKLSASKTVTNLRDQYYRNIILGERPDGMYQETDSHEIALAFREAGEFFGA